MAARKKKIVIAEDHRLFRDSLREMLGALGEVEVVGEAEDGLAAIDCVRQTKPDLLVLDLSMPRLSGLGVIRDIKSQFPNLKILVLTIHCSNQYLEESFTAGVDGYCTKESSVEEIMAAIKTVCDGKTFVGADLADRMPQEALNTIRRPKTPSD
jgi:DNA-binding NarL/FixJ family response regulator